MDVRCEKCRAEYVFRDDQVGEAGLAVRCSKCNHVFRVKKRVLVVTLPVKPGEVDATPPVSADELQRGASPSGIPGWTPPGGSDRPREWTLRKRDGALYSFTEVSTLQRWVVESKALADEEVARQGGSWRQLGELEQLAPFFTLVEKAARATLAGETPAEVSGRTPITAKLSRPGDSSLTPPPLRAGTPLPQRIDAFPGLGEKTLREPLFAKGPLQPEAVGLGRPEPLEESVTGSEGRVERFQPEGAPTEGSWVIGTAKSDTQPEFPSPPPLDQTQQTMPSAPSHPLPSRVPPRRQAVPRGVTVALVGMVAVVLGLLVWSPPWVPFQFQGLKLRVKPPATAKRTMKTPPSPATGQRVNPTTGQRADTSPAPQGGPTAVTPPASPAAGAAAPAGKIDAKTLVADARREREASKPTRALEIYGRVLEAEPKNVNALAGRGECFLNLARQTQAEASFKEALAIDPKHGPAILGLADTYNFTNRQTDALNAYKKYLALYPKSPNAKAARDAIKVLTPKKKEADASEKPAAIKGKAARAAARQAAATPTKAPPPAPKAEAKPEEPKAAAAAAAAPKPEAAKAAAPQKEPAPHPDEAKAEAPRKQSRPQKVATGPNAEKVKDLIAEGRAMRASGRPSQAVEVYGKAIGLDPSNADALAGRGECYLDLARNGQAESSFKEALLADPMHADALMGLAETYRYGGRTKEAISYYESYLKHHPKGSGVGVAKAAIKSLKE